MEIRTGFATGLPALSGGLFGGYLTGKLEILPLILVVISGFSFNIVANIANEIRAFWKNEENQTTFTDHQGSEGLVRGDASFLDGLLCLFFTFLVGSFSGLALVIVTKNAMVLLIGILSALAAITYSIGPKPYIVYPVGEFVSGLFAGGLSCFVSAYVQVGKMHLSLFLYAFIAMILTVFLMSTNNTADYDKDWGMRVTLPHVIGFRNSIKLIIPEAILMILAWFSLWWLGSITNWMLLSGLLIFYLAGYIYWYKDYYRIRAVYPEMGREWGPRPLLLIYTFHSVMSLFFLVALFI